MADRNNIVGIVARPGWYSDVKHMLNSIEMADIKSLRKQGKAIYVWRAGRCLNSGYRLTTEEIDQRQESGTEQPPAGQQYGSNSVSVIESTDCSILVLVVDGYGDYLAGQDNSTQNAPTQNTNAGSDSTRSTTQLLPFRRGSSDWIRNPKTRLPKTCPRFPRCSGAAEPH